MCGTVKNFRKWLKRHHDSLSEIWLVFHKRHTGVTSIKYDDAVEEADCGFRANVVFGFRV